MRRPPGVRAGGRAVGLVVELGRNIAPRSRVAAHVSSRVYRRRPGCRAHPPCHRCELPREAREPGQPRDHNGPRSDLRRDLVGASSGARSFKPYIGCMPTSGGGTRVPTSVSVFPPGQPVTRRVKSVRVRPGSATVRQSCRAGERLVGASHAFGFFTRTPPSASLMSSVPAPAPSAAARSASTCAETRSSVESVR